MNLNKVFLQKINLLIINSLGLVAALAWDNAFQIFFRNNSMLRNTGPWIYAILVTAIIVILTYSLNYQYDNNDK